MWRRVARVGVHSDEEPQLASVDKHTEKGTCRSLTSSDEVAGPKILGCAFRNSESCNRNASFVFILILSDHSPASQRRTETRELARRAGCNVLAVRFLRMLAEFGRNVRALAASVSQSFWDGWLWLALARPPTPVRRVQRGTGHSESIHCALTTRAPAFISARARPRLHDASRGRVAHGLQHRR